MMIDFEFLSFLGKLSSFSVKLDTVEINCMTAVILIPYILMTNMLSFIRLDTKYIISHRITIFEYLHFINIIITENSQSFLLSSRLMCVLALVFLGLARSVELWLCIMLSNIWYYFNSQNLQCECAVPLTRGIIYFDIIYNTVYNKVLRPLDADPVRVPNEG